MVSFDIIAHHMVKSSDELNIYILEMAYHRTSCTEPKEGLREPDCYHYGEDINDADGVGDDDGDADGDDDGDDDGEDINCCITNAL